MDTETMDRLGHMDTKTVDILGHMHTETMDRLGHTDTETVDILGHTDHISLESNLDRFLIPKIPKMDLRSSQIVESDGTLGISKTKNVPIFYTYL